MTNKLIGYFYDNIDSDYHIINEGIPKKQTNIITKLLNDDKEKVEVSEVNSEKSSFKFEDKNVSLNYISKGDSVYLVNEGEKRSEGDLDVDNKNSFYLGRHIIRDGDRPQKMRRAPDPMFECYHLNKTIFDKNEVFVDRSVSMTGCFKSNKVTLQRTMIPDTEQGSCLPDIKYIKKYEKAIKVAIRKLRIKTLSKCDIEDMNFLSFNKNTYAGFYQDKYQGNKTKELAASSSMKIARVRWKRIVLASKRKKKLTRNKIFPNTFVVGARNKRDFLYEDGDKISSRAVHMPDFHTELNSTVWIEQITRDIKFEEKGPLYIGNSIVKYERLAKDIFKDKFQIEGDWKRFDSRLYINNIIIGLSILRLYFPLDDDEIDYHFLALFDTIGIKDYITPGGYLYRLVHGLPSGVSSTSILGSIINLVNLIFCCEDADLKKIKLIVGGDDFLLSVDDSINCDLLIEKMKSKSIEIGQVFKYLKKKDMSSSNYNDRACFYKYTIDANEAVLNQTSLLERVFLPWNKKYDSNYKILKFLEDLIPSLGAPRTHHYIFYVLYSSIFYKVCGVEKTPASVFELHSFVYKKQLLGERFFRKKEIGDFINFSYIKNSFRYLTIKERIVILTKFKIKRLRKLQNLEK